MRRTHPARPVNVFAWHVQRAWMSAFVQGRQRTYVPVPPDRSAFGRARAGSGRWPGSVVEVTPEQARSLDVDVLVLQRPEELELATQWLGRRPGIDLPAVYVEHDAPQGAVSEMRHPIANRTELVLVHVTHFNRLFWDAGSTRCVVIEHGVVDPGHGYTGELARCAAVVNDPLRRPRVTGTDLLARLDKHLPIDLFGKETQALGGFDLPRTQLHEELARRRLYLHPHRWTSLGPTLLEAMHLGMPVLALATTELVEAVPSEAGVVSNRLDVLEAAAERLLRDPQQAREMGTAARRVARERYGLERFLADWERLFEEVVS